jgi:predicted O-linked N-acetylglucosamine transferase (SPINDLY family)
VVIVVSTVLIVNLQEIQDQICVTSVKTDSSNLRMVNALKKSVIQINTCTNQNAIIVLKIVLSAEFHALMEVQPVVHLFSVTAVKQVFR